MRQQSKTVLMACAVGMLGCLPLQRVVADELPSYAPVTQERLENPEIGNWLMFRRTYDGQGSARCARSTPTMSRTSRRSGRSPPGMVEGHQAPPMVNNGVMFVTTPGNAGPRPQREDRRSASGATRRPPPEDLFQLHPTNRGVALWGDKVYPRDVDCTLMALDAKTGKQVWEHQSRRLREGRLHDAGAAGGATARSWSARRAANSACAATSPPTMPTPARRCGAPTPSPARRARQRNLARATRGRPAAVRSGSPASTIRRRNLAYWGIGNAAPVDGRHAPRRQPLHHLGDRARPGHRQDQGPLTSTTGTTPGTGTKSGRRC